MNGESKNGKLIEKIITQYVNENIFEPTTEFRELLQENLNSILKFETIVTNIENKNNFIVGTVMFKNENEINSVVDFTIINNDKTLNV